MEAFDTFPFLKASQGYFQAWKVQVSEFVYFKEMKNACLFAPSKKVQCTRILNDRKINLTFFTKFIGKNLTYALYILIPCFSLLMCKMQS